LSSWQFVHDQLANAEQLARFGAGRPRQAALRRSVSTSYYALFHALCELSARNLVTWKAQWDIFTPIFRSVDHARARQILYRGGSRGPHPLGDEIERIGIAFKELQDAREWADYNPEPHFQREKVENGLYFSRAEALTFIDVARDAIERLNALDERRQKMLAALLVARARRDANR
jgi:hypothetical protein